MNKLLVTISCVIKASSIEKNIDEKVAATLSRKYGFALTPFSQIESPVHPEPKEILIKNLVEIHLDSKLEGLHLFICLPYLVKADPLFISANTFNENEFFLINKESILIKTFDEFSKKIEEILYLVEYGAALLSLDRKSKNIF